MKHLMEGFCMASMGAAKEAPRNIAEEAGRTGRSTAGNWCGEEEECLSTKPTQTQASSLNLLFTPQPLGTFLSDISSPPKLEQLLWLHMGCFFRTVYILFIRGPIPQGKLRQNTPYSANKTGQQMTAQQSSQTNVLIPYSMFDLIQIYSLLICLLMHLKIHSLLLSHILSS